ncbi:hypothetical protein EJB05_23513, partial [Eragrostis curvula]
LHIGRTTITFILLDSPSLCRLLEQVAVVPFGVRTNPSGLHLSLPEPRPCRRAPCSSADLHGSNLTAAGRIRCRVIRSTPSAASLQGIRPPEASYIMSKGWWEVGCSATRKEGRTEGLWDLRVGDSVVWCCSLVGARSLENRVDDEQPQPQPAAEGSQDAYRTHFVPCCTVPEGQPPWSEQDRIPNDLCHNCKLPGHFARECPNVAVCHACGLPGHMAAECSFQDMCWNCKEPGHMANSCPNEGICRNCGKSGHIAKDCTAPRVLPGEVILCSNCYKPGHLREECTNEKACNNCRQSGHIARNCTNDPVCNLCNVAGHLARQCPKADTLMERGGPLPFRGGGAPYHGGSAPFRGSYSDVICRSCHQVGHMSRDCMAGALMMICHNCGGRGHMAYECPSGRLVDRFPPRRY